MNLSELQATLDENSIPRYAYTFKGGLPDEQYCIARDDSLGWITYYSEKGSRVRLKAFATESEACEHFAQWLRHDLGRNHSSPALQFDPYQSPSYERDRRSRQLNPCARFHWGVVVFLAVLVLNAALISMMPAARSEDASSISVVVFTVINYPAFPIVGLVTKPIGPPVGIERGLSDYLALAAIGCLGAAMWGLIAQLLQRVVWFRMKRA